MPMLRASLLAVASLSLLALATPAASADEGPTVLFHCGFDAYAFHATYDCRVLGVGGQGALYWCPIDPGMCAYVPILGCYFDPWWQGCW